MEEEKLKYIRGKYSSGQKEATKKYNAKAYDNITIRVPKGNKAVIQKYADELSISLNRFVISSIEYAIEKDIFKE